MQITHSGVARNAMPTSVAWRQIGGSCWLCCILSVTGRGGLRRARASRLSAWPVLSRPGGTIAAYQGSIAPRQRRTRRRYRWRGGPGTRGLGRSAWWFSDRRAKPLPARPGAAPRRRNCGNECMLQRVWPDRLGDPGAAGYLADDPGGTMTVQPPTVCGHEDRSLAPLADGQVDRPRGARRERDGDHLAAFAGDHQGPVPALDAQGLDVGAGGFGDAQPVEGQQRDQRVLAGRAEPGGDQQRAELVAVQPGGVRLIIQPWPPDMGRGRVSEEFFFDGVPVEPRDSAQPTCHRGAGAAAGFQVAGEVLDVRAAGLEQAQLVLLAPAGELAQVQLVRLPGQPVGGGGVFG